MKDPITPEMIATLLEAVEREKDFWQRHGISHEDDTRVTGKPTPAHRAWVRAVELEYKSQTGAGRVHLDTPIARKAFILGFNKRNKP